MGRVLTGYARAAIVTASVAGALALTSCSDGADAQPSPSSAGATSTAASSTSSASSPSSSSSRPSSTATVNVPAAARAHTEDGAKAFAKFYYEILSDSQFRADSTMLRQLSTPECVACEAFAQKADAMRDRGQHVDSRSLTVRQSHVTLVTVQNGHVIDVLAEDRPSRVVAKDGRVVSTSRGSKLAFRTSVVWTDDGWKVSDSKLVTS